MLGDLTTSLTEISGEALDKIFESATEAPEGVKFNKQVESGVGDVPIIEDAAEIELVDEEGETVEETPEATTEATEEPATPEAKEEEKEKPEAKVSSDVLKSSVNFLIEKGIFKDFEGREDMEVDDETFSQLLEAQVNALVEEKYEAKKQSVGDYGEAILTFIEDGGDADKLIDIFKEQQAVQTFDVSTEEAQRQLISQYYKDVHQWKADRIKKHLDFLATDSETAFEEEATEIKTKYENHYKSQSDQLLREQAEFAQQQVEAQRQFEKTLKDAIRSYEVDEDTRKQLETSLFRFKEQDGRKVNAFAQKVSEIQADPKQYIELVEYVMNREKFIKRIANTVKTTVAEKTFKFVKQGSALSKSSGSSHQEQQEVESPKKKFKGTDFRFTK